MFVVALLIGIFAPATNVGWGGKVDIVRSGRKVDVVWRWAALASDGAASRYHLGLETCGAASPPLLLPHPVSNLPVVEGRVGDKTSADDFDGGPLQMGLLARETNCGV